MTGGPPPAAPPATQLPQGRYPASATTVWAVVAATLLIGLVLGVAIPAALAPDSPDPVPAAPVSEYR